MMKSGTKKRKERPLSFYFPASKQQQTSDNNARLPNNARSVTPEDATEQLESTISDKPELQVENAISAPLNRLQETLVAAVDGEVANNDEKPVELVSRDDPAPNMSDDERTEHKKPPLPQALSLQHLRRSSNVAHRILHQSLTGRRMPRVLPRQWSTPSWLNFCTNNTNNTFNTTVTHLAFDKAGVLLAVAYNGGSVAVFDWDMVQAANLQGRRRQSTSSRHNNNNNNNNKTVDPILQFRLPLQAGRAFSTVSFLQWNPFQEDILAVGNRATGEVHLYDLGHLAACLERQQSGALGAGTLVRPSCQKLATGVASPTETSLFFLDEGRKVLIAANQNLALWDLTRNKQLWSWKWNRRISSMAAASKDVVILGSNNGIMALVNHQRVQRTNFSLSPTPTILKEWVSYKGLDTPSGERCMGIRRLVVDCVWPHGDGLLHLNWVTFGGWHLSACVELSTVSTKYERPTIHHETAQVQCQNSAGEPVRPPRITWSLPVENKVQVTSTSDALFWEDVPAMTQILPGHDCRVAGMTEQSLYVRATGKPGLLCKFADHAPLSRIPLSKRKGSPTCLAVHPSHEWIVVGTKQDKFYVINSRPKV